MYPLSTLPMTAAPQYLVPTLTLLLSVSAPVVAIWPAPQSFTNGSSVLYLHENIAATYNGAPLQYTFGYEPRSIESHEMVQAGLSRTLGSIFSDKFVPWRLHKRETFSEFEPNLSTGKSFIQSLKITQTEADRPNVFKPLAGEVDESYNLTIDANGIVSLVAVSSIGVLRGLETFSQLFYQHSSGNFWYMPYAPVAIKDAPRFPHRGLLMDVARNYFPVKDILRTIDGLAWSKMNRLHVHLTDSQSWPLELPSMPEVSAKGAYHPSQVYTPEDVESIQRYGAHRGVQVVFEIDMPGHIGVLALSHPELIVAYDAVPYQWWCAEPPCGAFRLNNTDVEQFLDDMFDDLLPRVSKYSAYWHAGGDEVNANDSRLDPGVQSNASTVLQPLLQKFIDGVHSRVRAAALTPVTWEEIPLSWNVKIDKDTVVQTWLGEESVRKLTGMGHKIIDSNYNYWYLDCGRGQWLVFENGRAYDNFYPFNDWCSPTKSWQLVYSHDPAGNLTVEQAKNVLGGEVALWAETIDPVNFDQVAWPRASVAGEVLWSGRTDLSGKPRSQLTAIPRLNEFRERLVARGLGAAPIQMTWCMQAGAHGCEQVL